MLRPRIIALAFALLLLAVSGASAQQRLASHVTNNASVNPLGGSTIGIVGSLVGTTIDSIVIHSARGLPVVIRGPSGAKAVMMSVPTSRMPIGADSIRKIRAGLEKLASISKRAGASVSNMLLVVDALEAPTAAEYHRRIAMLPVKITVTPTTGGLRRDFYVRARLRLTEFVAHTEFVAKSVVAAGDDAAGALLSGPARPAEQGDGVAAAIAPSLGLARSDYCEYSDEFGYWSGDCATEADINDALATIAALDSDIDGLLSAATTTAAFDSDFDGLQAQTRDLEANGLQGELAVGGPSDMVTFSAASPCPTQPEPGKSGTAAAPAGCVREAIEMTAGVLGWIAAKYAAMSVMGRGAAATAAEVGWAVTGIIVSGFTFGFTLGSYLSCLFAT